MEQGHITTVGVLSFVILAFAFGSAAQTSVDRTATLLTPSPSGREPVSVWSGNGLVSIEGSLSAAPVLHVFDRSGTEVQRAIVQVPEAQLISILDGRFTRSTDGYLAVAGVAYGSKAEGDGFLAVVSPDSAEQILVRTNGYFIRATVFARDGSIWTAGLKVVGGREADDYPMIQRFSKTGKLLGSAMPRTRFPRSADPFTYSYMVASNDRVGWFSPMAAQYTEFSLDGRELGTYKHSLADIAGAALCDDNTLWVSVQRSDKPGEVQSVLYSLHRAHGTWLSRKTQGFTYLYGCWGTALATTVSGQEISWIGIH